MQELVTRLDSDDLPPTTIILRHHVQRPRFVPDQTKAAPGHAIVLLRYTPPQPRDTAKAKAEDAADQILEEGETSWDPKTDAPTN
jgi:hypothetical protein